jgi:radical SAM protein with 4Fe4S-binding SPASM domain
VRDYGDKVVFFPGEPVPARRRLGQVARAIGTTPPRHLVDKATRHLLRRFAPRSFPFPQWVQVEVTNACNLDCVMCPRRSMDRPVGFMDRGLFSALIAEMRPLRRYVEGLALMGLGEPLLHRDLIAMSREAKAAGFAHVYTSTNAQLLTPEVSERLVRDGGFDRVIFSVDGANEATYEAIRARGNYARLVENVEAFLAIKRRLGTSGPRSTIQLLVMDRTKDEVEPFLDRWVPRLGPTDDVLVKTVDTFGGQVGDYRVDHAHRPAERVACRQLWKDLAISWDGRVTVCCKDVLYRLAVGDARETPLARLWRSPKWDALRRSHLAGRWDMDPCDRCDEWYL